MQRATLSFLLLLAMMPLTRIGAQEPPLIEPGQRVRVWHQCRPMTVLWRLLSRTVWPLPGNQGVCQRDEGAFATLTADTIVLTVADGKTRFAVEADTLVVQHDPSTWRIPRRAITRLEISLGRESNAGQGALIGGASLAIPSAMLGVALTHICVFGGCAEPTAGQQVGAAVLVGAIGFGTGALIGAVIGSAIRTERWAEVPLDRLRVSLAPQRDGRFGLGLSYAF